MAQAATSPKGGQKVKSASEPDSSIAESSINEHDKHKGNFSTNSRNNGKPEATMKKT